MSTEIPAKPNYELQKKLRRRRALRDSWPLLIWMAVIAVAVWAYIAGGRFQRMRGYVSFNREYVAPLEESRIKAIRVVEGQLVKEGEILVDLDASLLDLERQAEEEAMRLDQLESRRRLSSEISSLIRERMTIQSEESVDRVLVTELKKQLTELEALRDRKFVTQMDVNDKRTEIAEVEARLANYAGIIEQFNADIAAAEALKKEMASEMVEPGEGAAAALASQQVENFQLRAAHTGKVSRVFRRAGEVVSSGEPVIELQAAESKKTVTALLEEETAYAIATDQVVYIASTDDRTHYQEARVISVSPDMMVVPDQASPIPNRMLRGRRVVLDLSGDQRLLPGQTVIIFMHKPSYLPFLGWLFE